MTCTKHLTMMQQSKASNCVFLQERIKGTLHPDLKPGQDRAHVSDSQTEFKGPLKVLLKVSTGQNTNTHAPSLDAGLDRRIMICMGTWAAKRSAICQLEGMRARHTIARRRRVSGEVKTRRCEPGSAWSQGERLRSC